MGDICTLPHWFGMTPFHVEPHESLVVSGEDLRCFFYTLRLPSCWYPYLCFNKPLPTGLAPAEYRGQTCYPCSILLEGIAEWGSSTSVGIAQHVHRVLVQRSQQRSLERRSPAQEAVWRGFV